MENLGLSMQQNRMPERQAGIFDTDTHSAGMP